MSAKLTMQWLQEMKQKSTVGWQLSSENKWKYLFPPQTNTPPLETKSPLTHCEQQGQSKARADTRIGIGPVHWFLTSSVAHIILHWKWEVVTQWNYVSRITAPRGIRPGGDKCGFLEEKMKKHIKMKSRHGAGGWRTHMQMTFSKESQ